MSGEPIDLAHEADFSLGAVLVRPSLRAVIVGGAEELIEPRVMQVLVALARRRGEVVSKDDLIAQCWNGRVVGDDAISRPIAMVRKLGETSGAFSIETIPRIGYRLKAANAASETMAPAAAEAPTAEPVRQPLLRRRHLLRSPKWVLGTGAAMLAAVLAVGVWTMTKGGDTPIPGRIAFFGIDFPAGDRDAAVAASATSSDILTSFAALQLDLAASGDAQDVEERLNRALDLRALYSVSGSATHQGDAISVTIRVEDTASRTTLWTQDFDGRTSNPAALASNAAATTSDRITCVLSTRSSLRTDDMRVVTRLPTACDSIRAAQPGNAERWSELAELAPNSAWVQAGLATALFGAIGSAPSPGAADDVRRRAEEALRKAKSIDPKLPPVFTARALEARDRGASRAELEKLYDEALDAAPKGPHLNGQYSAILYGAGQLKAAKRYLETALALDPLSAPKMLGLSLAMIHSRTPAAESEKLLAQRHAQFPDNTEWQVHVLAALFHGVGDVDAILREPPPEASPWLTRCLEDIAQEVRKKTSAARSEALRRAAECGASGFMDPASAAEARAFLGDFEPVFSVKDGLDKYYRFVFDPELQNLRMDPRFSRQAEAEGLVAYWRDSGHAPDFCATESAPVCDLIKAK